ncbi:MAG: trypsin-like peptidase domain-containing protein [Clostridia bacterium]|nr:trypsin-like peptidase domain-containing protein [Clostridia bacterium]
MKKSYFKIIISLVVAVALAGAFAACSIFEDAGGRTVVNAYDIAVKNGFEGTEEEWLESLKGKDGDNAQTVYSSLYEDAQKHGFEGTFDKFMEKYFNEFIVNMGESSVDKAADKALLSSVSVYSSFTQTVVTYDRRGNKIYNDEKYEGAGSGVIVDLDVERGDAYVITNFHVIYDTNDNDGYADKVTVYVYGRELANLGVEATIVGATATYDVAVLKITNSEIFRTSNLVAAEFGDSNLVTPGKEIFAVGNPEAAGISVTSGIVSVDSEYITMSSPKDEKTEIEYRVIRIDAAVNGGNSGGGLFDLNGKVVGIVNAKVVSSDIDNIAYAIPSSIVKNVYQNILRNCNGTEKHVKRCLVGVTIEIKDSYAKYDEALQDTRIINKVAVRSVEANGAASGKLKEGDILVSFTYEGREYAVERLHNLTDFSLVFEPGKTVTFKVVRGGREQTVNVVLGSAVTID